jgi:hypothetical protein
MSSSNISWGGSRSVEGQRSWQTSGAGEAQIARPMTENKQVQEATTRATNTILDAFNNLGQNAFGGAGYLLKSLAGGRSPDLGGFLAAAKFNPTDLAKDLRKIGTDLSKNPLDTIQNMMLGAPTAAIDKTLKSADGMLQNLENQTGLSRTFQGGVSKQIGDFRQFQVKKQLGEIGTFENTTKTKLGADFDAQGSMKVGLAGAQGQGRFGGSVGGSIESNSKLDTVLGSVTNTTRGFADATVNGQGSFKAGISGVDAQGSVGARAGIGVETGGQFNSALVSGNYSARAAAEAYANASGNAKLDATGLRANVKGEIGVSASAEAKADFRTAGIDLGGERLDIRGEGRVRATAEAKAEGTAKVDATINPPRASVDIGGRAFAGVKAEAEGKIGIGDFASVSGRIGAWAGAGAEAGVKLGYEDGKLRFGFNAGAAVGYGVGGSWGVEIDVKKIANAAIGTGLQMATKGLEYALDPTAVVRDATKAVANVEKTVNQAASTVQKVASTVTSAANSVVQGAANAINSVVNKFKFW